MLRGLVLVLVFHNVIAPNRPGCENYWCTNNSSEMLAQVGTTVAPQLTLFCLAVYLNQRGGRRHRVTTAVLLGLFVGYWIRGMFLDY